MTFCQLHTFLTLSRIAISPKNWQHYINMTFIMPELFHMPHIPLWNGHILVYTVLNCSKLRRYLKVFSANMFIQKISISTKSFVNEKASIIEKSSSPLCRWLRSRVLRQTRSSITLRKVLTSKSHRQRYKTRFAFVWGLRRLHCGGCVALWHTNTHRHVNQKKPPCIWSSLIIIFFYSRAIDRFFPSQKSDDKAYFFSLHIIVFFLQTHPHIRWCSF